jgi:DnaJ-class molecular chaperone
MPAIRIAKMGWLRQQGRNQVVVIKKCRYCKGYGYLGGRDRCNACKGTGKARTMVGRLR